tara:strand:- start:263 stop:415 length:153 start_codon:yes stop_codon:yes gene_type:complete
MIVIVDYKMGDRGSIKNMLRKIGVESKIISSDQDINSSLRQLCNKVFISK